MRLIECGNTSAFCIKGEVKPIKILFKNRRYIVTFANIGVDASLADNALNMFLFSVFYIF